VLRFLHRGGIEPARHGAAALVAPDQAGALQHIEVLEHGRQRHGERLGQGADGEFGRLTETGQHGAPGRVRQGGKDAVEAIWLMVNHQVKLWREIDRVNSFVLRFAWARGQRQRVC
jgi:hypothetical protein